MAVHVEDHPCLLLRLRGRDPQGRVRRRRRDRLGLGHLGAGGDRRPGAGRPPGRAQVQPQRREAQGPFHDRQDARLQIRQGRLAADPQSRRRSPIPTGTSTTCRARSRPAGRTTRSRPAPTRCGTAARRPARPTSTSPARASRAPARLHRPDEGDGGGQGASTTPTGYSKSSSTATASRRSSMGAACACGRATSRTPHATSPTWPVRRRPGSRAQTGDRRRRGRRARRGRQPELQAAPGRAGRAAWRGRPEAGARPIVYYVFDLLYLDGRSLVDVPLEQRKQLLRSVLREHPVVRYGSHIEGDGDGFLEVVRPASARGHGGQAAQQPVRAGPPLALLAEDQDPARAGGRGRRLRARPARGQGSRLAAGRGQRGRQAALRGEVGSGFDQRSRTFWRQELDNLRVDEPPVVGAPRIKNAHWAEPQLSSASSSPTGRRTTTCARRRTRASMPGGPARSHPRIDGPHGTDSCSRGEAAGQVAVGEAGQGFNVGLAAD